MPPRRVSKSFPPPRPPVPIQTNQDGPNLGLTNPTIEATHLHFTFVFIEGNVLEMVFEPPAGEPLRECSFYLQTFRDAKNNNATMIVGDWVIDTSAVVAFNVLEHRHSP